MKTDLFEIDPAAIKSAAALLATRLIAVAKPRTPEQTLRVAFQGTVDEIARRLKFNLDWRDEYHMIEGRADSVYGGLVLEYEPPCSLRESNRSAANAHAIQQVKEYIGGLQRRERHTIERYAGVVCDGNFFIFQRCKQGHWHTEPPVPVTPYSCERFLRHLRILQVDDFSNIQCFEGATNRTAVVLLQKGEQTSFPLKSYNSWRTREPRLGVSTECDHDEAMSLLTYAQWAARPINYPEKPASPWITGRLHAIEKVDACIGQSAYQGRVGTNCFINGIFWLQIVSERPDGNLVVSNLHDLGKIKVEQRTAAIEPDCVFPLLRGRDVRRWGAKPEYFILVPQNPDQPSRGYPVEAMQRNFPKTFAYLHHFEKQLRNRSGFRQFFNTKLDPFYSIYNVGTYTFTPYKVCWREVSNNVQAAVAEPPQKSEKVIAPDHTLVSVACETHEEAHFVCALLNSSPADFIVRGYVALHPSPHILKYIRIPKFNPEDIVHVRLAESSAACHAAVGSAGDEEMAALETTNDELAAQLWNLSPAELKDIKNSLADLG